MVRKKTGKSREEKRVESARRIQAMCLEYAEKNKANNNFSSKSGVD